MAKVHDIVQETGIQTIPMEKKCKKAKWLSGEALEIAVKRREGKSKGEKERYKHLNAAFQRIARKDKKAEDIKKRWQEYTEEVYKNDLHNQDNHDGVITHLQPDILECEVKWALESITMNKASWAISNPERWCCQSAALNMPANLENSAVPTGLEKVNFHSNTKER